MSALQNGQFNQPRFFFFFGFLETDSDELEELSFELIKRTLNHSNLARTSTQVPTCSCSLPIGYAVEEGGAAPVTVEAGERRPSNIWLCLSAKSCWGNDSSQDVSVPTCRPAHTSSPRTLAWHFSFTELPPPIWAHPMEVVVSVCQFPVDQQALKNTPRPMNKENVHYL